MSLVIAATDAGPSAADEFVTVASTTSTANSGLFDHILPRFTAATGIDVRVIARGTGQALEAGRRGDVDVVFVHARLAEETFVAEGWGTRRYDVMYNDFVVVGPANDPAGIAKAQDPAAVFATIAEHQATFTSRGDDSGTHKAERRIWAAADIDPAGLWYRETGGGMGATLNIAAEIPAYALTDRGTWISFNNRRDLLILFEGHPALHNPYGVIPVDPRRHPHVKHGASQAFVEWLISADGQAAIASYRIDGQQLFFPHTQP